MRHYKILILTAALLSLILAGCAPAAAPAATEAPTIEPVTLKIAVLPIIDTLPMYVAQQEGLFTKRGLNVEFVPVGSAPERDQLIAADQADGMINETISTMLFNKDKAQVQVVRYALRPTADAPHFFILASAQSGITTPGGLKNVEIGVSQGTVIEYVTDRLLEKEGFAKDEIKTIAVPKIPDRMSLLASGELKAGVLPDPLSALAVQQGAVVVLNDSKYPEYGFSVISFRKEVIDANPEAVKGFLAAIEEATALLNSDPAKYTTLLSDNKLVPPPLLATYKAPPFPAAGVPTESEWADALAWAKEKGMLSADVSYADSVNSSLLPRP
ncbi:MAG: ABC transporter substrate-binding protein [Chloroflexi bacterium]|nr:ABC transporter substrate-binding protein [Chloroflexota bacterium]